MLMVPSLMTAWQERRLPWAFWPDRLAPFFPRTRKASLAQTDPFPLNEEVSEWHQEI
jgi:hypothetical protein